MKKILRSIPGLKRVKNLLLPGTPNPRAAEDADWIRVLDREKERWERARTAASGGPRVLIATSAGGHKPAVILEHALAMALTLDGAEVHVLLCDAALPACEVCQIMRAPQPAELVESGPGAICNHCYKSGRRCFEALGLPIHTYSSLITAEERSGAAEIAARLPTDQIRSYCLKSFAVGEHALAGALRYFARGTLEGEPQGEGILRRYFEAGILTARAVDRLFSQVPFEAAVFHHGIYIPHGIVGEVARKRDVRVVNWCSAYRKRCFIFSHGDTYHHTLMDEPVSAWEDMPWDEQDENEILGYLKSRWQGTHDWIKFNEAPNEDVAAIRRALGIVANRPCIGLLTNVVWDAQLHYPANAFPNMLDWVTQTIAYFAKRPDLQLIIRVHPAEVRGSIPSRQPVLKEIERAFPSLPPNVVVIGPEDPTSTYAAMLQCNAVIIYGTKTGVELTSLGIPVIVAGEAWIRNKGLTTDATSVADYRSILDSFPLAGRLSEEQTRRARKYACHFFFRRMVPIECIEPTNQMWPPYRLAIRSLDDLEPENNPGLATIARGILTGSPFIYAAGKTAGAAVED